MPSLDALRCCEQRLRLFATQQLNNNLFHFNGLFGTVVERHERLGGKKVLFTPLVVRIQLLESAGQLYLEPVPCNWCGESQIMWGDLNGLILAARNIRELASSIRPPI